LEGLTVVGILLWQRTPGPVSLFDADTSFVVGDEAYCRTRKGVLHQGAIFLPW
jgi:hypothetical protein